MAFKKWHLKSDKMSKKILKKSSTKKLIAELEQHYSKTQKKIFRAIARELSKPSRNLHAVNLRKLNSLNEKFKGKTFVVPGKVLSSGELNGKVRVAALGFSETAKQKINELKGEALSLNDLIQEKINVSELVIVK